jgi:REP element-mobilizing transposase RayT
MRIIVTGDRTWEYVQLATSVIHRLLNRYGAGVVIVHHSGQTWFFVFPFRHRCSVGMIVSMPRRLRLEFEGAIYHVMARGNARRPIVHDDDDRRRLLHDLERTVVRSGRELPAFVVMSNHLHLLVKTPRANLAAGMQRFHSSYAHWSLRRRRRLGHLFEGRYRAELIEDESYYWTVSRYIHLNPVRARLVARPEQWAWWSLPGLCPFASALFLGGPRGTSGGMEG